MPTLLMTPRPDMNQADRPGVNIAAPRLRVVIPVQANVSDAAPIRVMPATITPTPQMPFEEPERIGHPERRTAP